MPHEGSLIATIAIGFVFAFVFGLIASKLRLPPLIGYLIGGVFIGRYTPGFVADTELTGQLAEIGVMLLMLVGLHFSAADYGGAAHRFRAPSFRSSWPRP
jgi:CPA2 family monovalent cation:H+ antiporter-2